MTTQTEVTFEDNQIVFYCKECKRIDTSADKIGRRYVYKCPECNSKHVAFGTYRSIKSHYLKR